MIRELLAKFFPSKNEELRLVRRALISPSDLALEGIDPSAKNIHVLALISFINGPEFGWCYSGGLNYVSRGGSIFVCNDIHGFEVKLLKPWGKLLDCEPSYYNLTYDQGQALYNVIVKSLSNVRVEL